MYAAQPYLPPRRRKTRQILQSARPRMLSLWQGFTSRLPMAGAFFLLSLARCFSVPSPYALCCLAAFLYTGIKPRGAAMGLIAAFLFRLLWGMDGDPWLFAACLLCYPLMKLIPRRRGMLYTATGALVLLRHVPEMAAAQEMVQVILHCAGMVLGMIAMPALSRAVQLIGSSKKEFSEDDVLCMLLPGLLMLSGATRLMAFGVNIGYFISCLAVLLLCWIGGVSLGICSGMACGLALMLGGQSALMLVNLTLGALVGGIFQGKKKALTAAGFLVAVTAATYLTTLRFIPQLTYAAGGAGVIFLFFPGRWMRKCSRWIRRIRWVYPRENAYTRLKMQRWVRAIDSLADALPHPRVEKPSPEDESEALAEQLCQGCDQLPICWHERFVDTKAGMMGLARRGEGAEDYLDIINQYFSVCPRISRIPALLDKLDSAQRQRAQRALCADYERDMLQTHLTALSQAAQRISLEGNAQQEDEEYWLSQTEDVLQGLHFPGQAAFVKRIDGRMCICLKYETLSLRTSLCDQLIRHLGMRLQVNLQVTEQQQGRVLLEEEPPLMIDTGMATACAVPQDRRQKGMQPVDNGDAVLVRDLTGGKTLLALSDGMGHGAGASEESRKTLEMLSLCMEAGYSRAQAMTAVNGAMLSATGGEKFATVDLCLVDLWTGEASMNKLGACASVLFLGQKMHLIEGAALPLGIIEHVVPMEHHFTLGEGDVLLMMSDGVMDAFAAEEEILSVLRRGWDDSPQHIADALLQAAMIQKDGMPPDDMTVLCARAHRRHPEQNN